MKVHYDHCPVCGSSALTKRFFVKDHTVSGQDFEIIRCRECGLGLTQDVPGMDEIGQYYKAESYISHTDTSKGLINRLYKMVRSFTLRSKRRLVEGQTGVRSGKLLDIGAGTGFFLAEMKKAGWSVTGLEPDAEARSVALKNHGLEIQEMGHLSGLPPATFDAITLWHVLEHVHDLTGYVSRFHELLAENGRVFIAVPNHQSYDASAYGQHWAAYDVPRHLYHFSPESIRRLFEDRGFVVHTHKPMLFDSYYVSLLSSQYKNGKTNWIGAVFTASVSNLLALFNTRKCSSVIYVIRKKITG